MKSIFFPILLVLSAGTVRGQFTFDTSAAVKNVPGIYSILITKHDRVVYSHYFNGGSAETLFNDQSLTKSIGAILIGIAIDKGFIPSVDEPISRWFPSLKTDSDGRKATITLRQVMNQASGLYHEDLTRLGAFLSLDDPSGRVLSAPLAGEPGKAWVYNNAASHLLSVILTKSTGMDTRAFAAKFLFTPLDIITFEWMKMRDGFYDGSGLLSVRLRSADLLKIGSLLLHEGKYNDRQIVSGDWVHAILEPTVIYPAGWGFHSSTYALDWYHAEVDGVKFTYGMGWGGQFVVVIPSLSAVVVINENVADATAVRQSVNFTSRLFALLLADLKN